MSEAIGGGVTLRALRLLVKSPSCPKRPEVNESTCSPDRSPGVLQESLRPLPGCRPWFEVEPSHPVLPSLRGRRAERCRPQKKENKEKKCNGNCRQPWWSWFGPGRIAARVTRLPIGVPVNPETTCARCRATHNQPRFAFPPAPSFGPRVNLTRNLVSGRLRGWPVVQLDELARRGFPCRIRTSLVRVSSR